MVTINYKDANDPKALIESVTSGIKGDGVVLLRNFTSPDNSNLLLNLAQNIGVISIVGINVPENKLDKNLIHNIDSRKKPIVDKYGFVIQSTTNNEFAFHTDDYFSPNPVDAVLFHCITQSKTGGETKICYVDEFVNKLPSYILSEIQKKQFPVHFGLTTILHKEKGVNYCRYNRLEMLRASQINNTPLSKKQIEILDYLDSTIKKVALSFKMRRFDCIIFSNKRVLHGRNGFPINSKRLFKRLRLHYT